MVAAADRTLRRRELVALEDFRGAAEVAVAQFAMGPIPAPAARALMASLLLLSIFKCYL